MTLGPSSSSSSSSLSASAVSGAVSGASKAALGARLDHPKPAELAEVEVNANQPRSESNRVVEKAAARPRICIVAPNSTDQFVLEPIAAADTIPPSAPETTSEGNFATAGPYTGFYAGKQLVPDDTSTPTMSTDMIRFHTVGESVEGALEGTFCVDRMECKERFALGLEELDEGKAPLRVLIIHKQYSSSSSAGKISAATSAAGLKARVVGPGADATGVVRSSPASHSSSQPVGVDAMSSETQAQIFESQETYILRKAKQSLLLRGDFTGEGFAGKWNIGVESRRLQSFDNYAESIAYGTS